MLVKRVTIRILIIFRGDLQGKKSEAKSIVIATIANALVITGIMAIIKFYIKILRTDTISIILTI